MIKAAEPQPVDWTAELARAYAQYVAAQAELDRRSFVLKRVIVGAMGAGMTPAEAAERSGFSPAWVRKIAREAGLPPAPRGGRRPGAGRPPATRRS
jgi:hypothetical protein